ncbi:hypothetical protein BGZ61DRAFT_447584 [Ilyonectria robusta]|uniref:uncharacterized protein n=1 Tax=Ilyonectria robusta TaxID=1079257 RepID=UPI001E8DD347|nr:uncharacterized protein BGZ61DRAFT_447584 [Ilyonectria robusta]KAH8721880.1 hypothetical protein BGZ61DRAFT_447584 [Ilyonectria robusta]
MAPGTRRANRSGYADHDDFEGLPVRQWRHDWVNVAPPPQQEQQQQNDIWSIDVIHGMPKDSHLLPTHSQELLLAARSGRLYKRPAPVEEEEADPEAIPEKPEKKEEDDSAKGYSIKLWKQIPRNVEAPAVSHLAKRRKNTVTIASKTIEDKPTVTRVTVRKVDVAAPQNARKRPNPPKRKSRAGPGRGKKRGRIPLLGAGQPVAAAVPINGAAAPAAVKPEPTGDNGIKQESEDNANHDSEMADGDDDDDDNDDDEGEDGNENEDGDEGAETPAESTQHGSTNGDGDKAQDHEMADAVPAVETSSFDPPDVEMGGNEVPSEPQAPPNPLSLAPPPPPLNLTPSMSKLEGSPLKNVIMPSPTTEVPPDVSLDNTFTTEPVVENVKAPEATPIVEPVTTEPPSAAAEEAPETTPDAIAPKDESPKEDTLLPPPHEQVGNIATTPTAEDSGSTVADSAEIPIEEVETGEEAILENPPLEQDDITMTEDAIKQEDSAPASIAMSEPAELPPVEPEAVEDIMETDVLAEAPAEPTPEEAKPASPLKEETPVVADAAEEPDLLGGLLGELDRQVDEKMEMELELEMETLVSEPAVEPAAEPTPEPIPELALEATPESAPEAVPEAAPEIIEPVVKSIFELVAESAVEPEVEPVVESVDEPVVDIPLEPAVEPAVELVVEPVVEPVIEPAAEPAADAAPELTAELATEPAPEPVLEFAPEPVPASTEPSEAPVPEAEPSEKKVEEPIPEVPVPEISPSEIPAADPPVEAPPAEKKEDNLAS